MLSREKLSLQDFDIYEIHEAFAAQLLCTLRAWEDAEYCTDRLGPAQPPGSIDPDKINVNGGSLACGHPFPSPPPAAGCWQAWPRRSISAAVGVD